MIPPPPRSTLFPYTTLFRSLSIPPTRALASSLPFAPSKTNATPTPRKNTATRSEEHTSELQSHSDLVCRLLLEKKNKKKKKKHSQKTHVDIIEVHRLDIVIS